MEAREHPSNFVRKRDKPFASARFEVSEADGEENERFEFCDGAAGDGHEMSELLPSLPRMALSEIGGTEAAALVIWLHMPNRSRSGRRAASR